MLQDNIADLEWNSYPDILFREETINGTLRLCNWPDEEGKLNQSSIMIVYLCYEPTDKYFMQCKY